MELTSWKTWALCVGAFFLCSLSAVYGYMAGHDKAEAEGLAALNALRAASQEEKRRTADAYGKAVADALEQYREQVSRGDDLAGKIMEADKAHAAENAALKRKISHATRDTTCTVDPDVVRLLNNATGATGATGARVPDAALPGDARAADTAGGAGAGQAPDSRLLGRGSHVTQADLLAWTLDYIARTRRLEDRLAGWRELFTKRAKQGAEGGE